jgi:hypothetical protein
VASHHLNNLPRPHRSPTLHRPENLTSTGEPSVLCGVKWSSYSLAPYQGTFSVRGSSVYARLYIAFRRATLTSHHHGAHMSFATDLPRLFPLRFPRELCYPVLVVLRQTLLIRPFPENNVSEVISNVSSSMTVCIYLT